MFGGRAMNEGGRTDDYRDGVRLQLRDGLGPFAVVEPVPSRRRRDWVLAIALAAVASAIVIDDDQLPLWARAVPAILAVAFVPFRRQVPLLAVSAVSVVTAAIVLAGARGREVTDLGSPTGMTDLVLLYALCRWASPPQIAAGLAVSVVAAAATEWGVAAIDGPNWAFAAPWLTIAAFAMAMRYRARAIAGRYDRVRLEERNALARELHDTVAHHVSAIAVQAQAGQYVAGSDPAAATEALRSIETIANDSIEEMRRMVGILRSDDHHARSVAPHSLDVLMADDGRPVVRVRGDSQVDGLPAAVGAALFRIAQESITNARRHSRDVSFVDVAVARHPDHVEMTVDNDGTPTTRHSGSGYGEVGMRERAEALGGTFESAARPAFGWRTRTSIPLGTVRTVGTVGR